LLLLLAQAAVLIAQPLVALEQQLEAGDKGL